MNKLILSLFLIFFSLKSTVAHELNPARLIINEIATLNEEEIKKLKEIQYVLHDLGIRKCTTDYGHNKNGFYKKEAS